MSPMPWRYILCGGRWIGNSLLGGPAQVRSRLFRARVVDERPRPELDAREVFQPVAPPVRGVELEVEVCLRPLAAVGRRLVRRHDVWRREPEMGVVRPGSAEKRVGELV